MKLKRPDFSNTIFFTVENWSYSLSRESDSRFLLIHHVTPADGGYGVEVERYLPKDYFAAHSVKEFYKSVTQGHCSPDPKWVDKQAELKRLKELLESKGWI